MIEQKGELLRIIAEKNEEHEMTTNIESVQSA